MKRKVRMRKMLREEDIEELLKQAKEQEPEAEKGEAATPKPEKAETPADKVLQLQKSAGNSAVGAMLERVAGPSAQPSRVLATWPEAPQMRLDGDAPITIDSVQDATQKPPTAREEDPEGAGEFVVHLQHGKHTTDLQRAVVEGRHCAAVELVIPGKAGNGMRWLLRDVYLSVGSISPDGQTVQLSFKSRKLVFSPPVSR